MRVRQIERGLAAAVMLLAMGACDRGLPRADPPQVVEARQAAARDACIAAALVDRSRESLEALLPLEDARLQAAGAARAAIAFSRAYEQYAQLHFSALAHADSAVNHARTAADSTRYVQRGEAYLPRPPGPETLEANVAAAWFRDFAVILGDEDHRCHWGI